jgi:hypothetical protein
MGYPTSNPTIYSAKPVPGEASKEAYSHPDANMIRTLFIALSVRMPCIQSVGLSTAATSYFTPTWPGVPKGCVLVAKDTTAAALLAGAAGYKCTKLSANRITFVHGTGTKTCSAYAIAFY